MSVQHNTLSGADLHVAGYIDAADPGAIGYGKYWVDTTNGAGAWLLKVRNALNTGWESIRTPAESIAHGDLSDMPDTGGTNSDHDARYYTETESDARFVMLDQTTAQTITASPIFDWGTSTRIPYYSATKTLTDSANLTFDGTRLTNVDYIEFNDTDLNTKIGYQAGKNIVSGAQANTFVGNGAGTSAAVGGTNAADQNCAFGYQAFTANATGAYNTMLGAHVASARTSGNYNTMVGYYSNTAGIGTGDNNSCFGSFSGYGLSSGTNNTLIGYSAASMLQTGSGNVCLGYMAGNYETGSNAFYVDNQDRTNTAGDKANALLYGIFAATPQAQRLQINAEVDFAQGNITYVPLLGNIATYITNATAGDTLVLAAGTYTITSGLTVNKKLHIRGQGRDLTTITCATADIVSMIDSTANDSMLSDMTLSTTSEFTAGTNTILLIRGRIIVKNVYFNNVATGISTKVCASVTFATASTSYIDSCIFNASGSIGWHGALYMKLIGAVANVSNCIFTGSNGTRSDGNNIVYAGSTGGTINLYSCSMADATNLANGVVAVQHASAAINCYNCTINGSGATAYDVLQTAGTLTLYNTTLVNGTKSGTISYGGQVNTSTQYIGGASATALQVGTDLYVDTTNHRVGVGVVPATAGLSIDSNSNTACLRLYGADATKEIYDQYLDGNGGVVFSALSGSDTYGYFSFEPQGNTAYGWLLKKHGGSATVYSNFVMNDAATDYLNMVIGADNSTLGLTINANQQVGIGEVATTAGLSIDSNSNTACLRLKGADAANEYADFYVTAANDLVIDSTGNTYLSDTITYVKDLQPETDNTYYLGKNDDDTPKAWKGVVLKDTTNGKYYRVEVINGTVTATDLTD